MTPMNLLRMVIVLATGFTLASAAPTDNIPPARFCTTSEAEESKCQAMKKNFAERGLLPGVECVRAIDEFDCMQLIERREADIYTYWTVHAYVAGKVHNLVPFMRENSNSEPGWSQLDYSVAVVRKDDTSINSLQDLQGKRSCHSGVNSLMGWYFPMAQLMSRGLIQGRDCNNGVANMASFFSEGCAPNANKPYWNTTTLCNTCKGEGDNFCTFKDGFGGYEGAVICLLEGGGDVSFIRHHIFDDMIEKDPEISSSLEGLELLCLDGTRKPLNEFKDCTWGAIPDEMLMTSPELSQNLFEAYSKMLDEAQKDQSSFKLFESSEYGGSDLLFADETKTLEGVGDKNTYDKYLGDYMMVPPNQYPCNSNPVRWCTISTVETQKCIRWRDALAYRLLRPVLECVQASDTNECMKKIKEGDADVIDLDGGDIYKGGKDYNLQVIANENTALGDAKYYSVAVAKKSNSGLNFNNLKGKKSCHTGIGRSAGWKIPAGVLLSTGQISTPPDCNIAKAVGEFFSESCAPGALSAQFNPDGENPSSLCSLCAGTGDDKCARNENEPFYGYTGAFKCMATGVGDVAFVKQSTPTDNTDGHNQDPWAKDLHLDDFELLCKDGSRKPPSEYKTCNWAKVPAHAVVTQGTKTNAQIAQIIFFLDVSQDYFGNSSKTFRLFFSGPGAKDLLFTDTTGSLTEVPCNKRPYREYLGTIADVYDNINKENCSPQ